MRRKFVINSNIVIYIYYLMQTLGFYNNGTERQLDGFYSRLGCGPELYDRINRIGMFYAHMGEIHINIVI